jgi:glycosyltransferase involved in cell wall biosynthesis
VEIVGDEPGLRFTSDDDAVGKIARVLASDEEQRRLAAHLAAQSARFSADRFCRDILEVVDEVARAIPTSDAAVS